MPSNWCSAIIGTPRREWNVYDELQVPNWRNVGYPRGRCGSSTRRRTTGRRPSSSPSADPVPVSVLIGSTEKMGVGTNVQAPCGGTPSPRLSVAARGHRATRGQDPPPGEPQPRCRVLRYVTESSFDVFMWGTVERKAAFIAQVTRGDTELARQHRRRRRAVPQLRRGEGSRHRQPADHGKGGRGLRSGEARTSGRMPTPPNSAGWRRRLPAPGRPRAPGARDRP